MAQIGASTSEKIYSIGKWLGLNQNPDGDTKLKYGEAAVMENWKITRDGNLRRRPGTALISALGSGPVRGLWSGIVDGNECVLAACDDKLYRLFNGALRFHSCGASVDISSFNLNGMNTISCTSSGITVNGTEYSLAGTGTDNNYPIRLFSVYNEGSHNGNKGHFTLYSCQMRFKNTLVRDFAPCINPAAAVGLYDKAGKQFYTNGGSGNFIGG